MKFIRFGWVLVLKFFIKYKYIIKIRLFYIHKEYFYFLFLTKRQLGVNCQKMRAPLLIKNFQALYNLFSSIFLKTLSPSLITFNHSFDRPSTCFLPFDLHCLESLLPSTLSTCPCHRNLSLWIISSTKSTPK